MNATNATILGANAANASGLAINATNMTALPILSVNATNATITGFYFNTQRGTLDIVWSCLFTLFLCLWVAIRTNIVVAPSNPPKGLLSKFRNPLPISKLKWFIRILFVPELALAEAITELRAARSLRDLQNLDKHYSDHEATFDFQRPSTASLHSSYCPLRKNIRQKSVLGTTNKGGAKWQLSHGFFHLLGGLRFRTGDAESDSKFLNASGFTTLAELDMLPSASILREEITARQSSDWILKVLVVVQVTWLFSEILGRLILRLPVTLLEFNTIATILYAGALYLIWGTKPRGIKKPVELDLRSCPACLQTLKERGFSADRQLVDNPPSSVDFLRHIGGGQDEYNVKSNFFFAWLWLVSAALLGIAYWCIHGYAGVFGAFPTKEERVFWWFVLGFMVLGMLFLFHYYRVDTAAMSGRERIAYKIGTYLTMGSRILFIFLAIVSLRGLSADAYIVPSWTSILPHIG
jgi:hypothetical protein